MEGGEEVSKIIETVEVWGTGKLCKDRSVRMELLDNGNFLLHMWKPDKKSFGRVGTSFSRPEAIREYARGLLEMADRFEAQARPAWERAGGTWMSPEEISEASK